MESQDLEWHPKIHGPLLWDVAINFASTLGEGWRLPTIQELVSLWNYETGTVVDKKYECMLGKYFWSSSSTVGNGLFAWVIEYLGGHIEDSLKSETCLVRCVRSRSEIDSLNIRSFDSSRNCKLKGILDAG